MKQCKGENCKNQIDEKYQYCLSCMNNLKQSTINAEMLKTLQHMNWNLGNIAKAAMKLAKTEPLEKPK